MIKKLLIVFLFVFFVSMTSSFSKAEDGRIGITFVPGNLPCKLWIPHYDISDGWWSGVAIHNMSQNANQYRVVFPDNDSNVLNPQGKTGALTSFAKTSFTIDTQDTGGASQGWVAIESQHTVSAFVLFGQGESLGSIGPYFSLNSPGCF